MSGKPGPFEIIESQGKGDVPSPGAVPLRRYNCSNYERCLDLAAALNWDSFGCSGCNGEVNEALCWRAHQARKKDRVVDRICHLPEIKYLETETAEVVEIPRRATKGS